MNANNPDYISPRERNKLARQWEKDTSREAAESHATRISAARIALKACNEIIPEIEMGFMEVLRPANPIEVALGRSSLIEHYWKPYNYWKVKKIEPVYVLKDCKVGQQVWRDSPPEAVYGTLFVSRYGEIWDRIMSFSHGLPKDVFQGLAKDSSRFESLETASLERTTAALQSIAVGESPARQI